MFSDSSVNHNNGIGYNSVIEANSSSEPGNRSEKEVGLAVQKWNVTNIIVSASSLPSDCSFESSSLLDESYLRTPFLSSSSPTSSLSFALRRVQLAQGRPNPLVALLCGRNRKAAFRLLPL